VDNYLRLVDFLLLFGDCGLLVALHVSPPHGAVFDGRLCLLQFPVKRLLFLLDPVHVLLGRHLNGRRRRPALRDRGGRRRRPDPGRGTAAKPRLWFRGALRGVGCADLARGGGSDGSVSLLEGTPDGMRGLAYVGQVLVNPVTVGAGPGQEAGHLVGRGHLEGEVENLSCDESTCFLPPFLPPSFLSSS
jgi:hypothetical protein